MSLSFVQYVGDGRNRNFAVPFPYIDQSHIVIRVNGETVPYIWLDPNTVQTATTPPEGAIVDVRRETPRDNRFVTFNDGSVLTGSDINLAVLQTFYIVQEAIDIAGGTLGIQTDGSYTANFRRIAELGDPVNPYDAVNRRFFEQTFLPQQQALLAQTAAEKDAAVVARQASESARNTAQQHRENAAASATAAANSANASAGSATNAANSATAAASSATNAANSASMATTQAGNASSSASAAAASATAANERRNEAQTFRNDALAYRNEARQFRDEASASADRAALFDPTSYVPKTGGTFTGNVFINGGAIRPEFNFGTGGDPKPADYPIGISTEAITAAAAGPSSAFPGVLHSVTTNKTQYTNRTYQIAYRPNSDELRVRSRAGDDNTWTPWKTLVHSGNITEFLPETAHTGEIRMFAGSSAPSGWLLCQGQAVSRTTYSALFAVIGTTYGAGNGSSTFNLPDFRGRAPIGVGQGSGLTNRALGARVGAETHTLSINEIPSHSHSIATSSGDGPHRAVQQTWGYTTNMATTSTGSGQAHNNMQPSLTINFIIKT
ncbi:phage tail fiber protein [Telmatospirillum sp. J64-1]|uniref:phage tail fiber domain-containing protein n=1 Tax=Telmatospirillum sp. J64-1 TaxID=2502183 RepID=UPI00115D163A|nr:phage tail fiber protein [Telmatospirillum sp. J64-1]